MRIRIISRVLTLFLSSLFVLTAAVSAVDVIAPSAEFYVNDQSAILSDETVQHILETAGELEDLTGAQICVVTVDFIGAADIDEYAYKLFNEWGIGSAEKNNGLLLLVVIGEENYYLLQGKGLENVLSAGKLRTILDEAMEPDFAVEEYDAGIRKTYDALLGILCRYYNVDVGGTQTDEGVYDGEHTRPALTKIGRAHV